MFARGLARRLDAEHEVPVAGAHDEREDALLAALERRDRRDRREVERAARRERALLAVPVQHLVLEREPPPIPRRQELVAAAAARANDRKEIESPRAGRGGERRDGQGERLRDRRQKGPGGTARASGANEARSWTTRRGARGPRFKKGEPYCWSASFCGPSQTSSRPLAEPRSRPARQRTAPSCLSPAFLGRCGRGSAETGRDGSLAPCLRAFLRPQRRTEICGLQNILWSYPGTCVRLMTTW